MAYEDHPTVYIGMTPSHTGDPKLTHYMRFDAHTGELLHDAPTVREEQFSFMGMMLALSQPLHFGDYGGLPLKLLWALLDLLTIVVLASGLYLWIARRKANDVRGSKP